MVEFIHAFLTSGHQILVLRPEIPEGPSKMAGLWDLSRQGWNLVKLLRLVDTKALF